MDILAIFMEKLKGDLYPFNLNPNDQISMIKLKLSNTSITINNDNIIADKPIFIEYKNDILFIWNTIQYPLKIEESYRDNIYYLDFEGNEITAWPIYHFTFWVIQKITKLHKIILMGNNNDININDSIIDNKNNNIIKF